MGTRYEDQPPEHWAGPESLDPTPVWKQFMLVGILLLVGLGLIAVFAYASLAVQFATPPAVVPGGRVVLERAALPAVGAAPTRIGAPLVDEADAFWLAQPARNDVVAVSARWRPAGRPDACAVIPAVGIVSGTSAAYVTQCPEPFFFGPHGEPGTAPRGVDRYLVAVEGDRVVVNISRVIRGYGATAQPVQPALTPYR